MSDNEGRDRALEEDNMDVDVDSDDSDNDMFHLAEEDIGPMPMPNPHLDQIVYMPAQQVQAGAGFPAYLFNDRSNRRFSQDLRVLSVVHLENRGHQNLESGGKVILPPSALQQLSRNSSALMSPMMFKATNLSNPKFTHCGVLEFIAEEDYCYMPSWMMANIGVVDYQRIRIEKVELPTATFAKFQPQSVDFLDISNPKAMLENCLRFFACLTKGDVIAIHYNSRVYRVLVLELLPGDAVNIIECDMNVDFAAPVGYVSPSASRENMEEGDAGTSSGADSFVPFTGGGNRLNGKSTAEETTTTRKAGVVKGAPDSDWKIGSLQFKRKFAKANNPNDKSGGNQGFRAFGGTGQTLKKKKDDGSNS